MSKKIAIVGGGAAGFFLAANLKEMMPEADITIMERGQRVLRKVEVSGGGRCNCTNTFRDVQDLQTVYSRGYRLMKRLMKGFNQQDAFQWFERHGVPLVIQEDQCVFPAAQDSHAIIECLTSTCRRHHVTISTNTEIKSLDELRDFDFVAVTTGGQPNGHGLQWLSETGHEIEPPVPSLFTFNIDDRRLHDLMGTVVEAALHIPSTKLRAEGPLLITHWGMSGPAALRLSSYAARYLAEHDYASPVSVNWCRMTEADVQEALSQMAIRFPQKRLTTISPCQLSQRLWAHLAERTLDIRSQMRWGEMGRKDITRLTNTLTNDLYQIAGRAAWKEEFVTCGGVSLKAVQPATLESRHVPNLYFAGEVLDIDGVTGGFNFQAAWTTAYTVARSIAERITEHNQ